MKKLLLLVLVGLLAFASTASFIVISKKINAGSLKIVAGEKQLAHGEQVLAAGKEKLAGGEQQLSSAKQNYNNMSAASVILATAVMPGTGTFLAIAGNKAVSNRIAEGDQMVAEGREKVKDGEQRLAAGKQELNQGKARLDHAIQIRKALGIASVFFLAMFVLIAANLQKKKKKRA